GKAQRNIVLNAAPLDIAEFLRRRLFSADTSVVLTSATLSVAAREGKGQGPVVEGPGRRRSLSHGTEASDRSLDSQEASGLDYFAKRVGGSQAVKLQVGSPFDYPQQMKVFITSKMPDPREDGYREALIHWIGHFVEQTHGKAFVLFTNFKLMLEVS